MVWHHIPDVFIPIASERRGNHLQNFNKFYLSAKARSLSIPASTAQNPHTLTQLPPTFVQVTHTMMWHHIPDVFFTRLLAAARLPLSECADPDGERERERDAR